MNPAPAASFLQVAAKACLPGFRLAKPMEDFDDSLDLCFCACGASGVAGGSLLLIPLACSLFGINSDVVMQVVMVGMLMCSSLVSSESVHSPFTAICAMIFRLKRLFLCEIPFRLSSSCRLKNSVNDVIVIDVV